MTSNQNEGHCSGQMLRLGIDLGGTKIEGVVLDPGGRIVARRRVETPRGSYDATVEAVGDLAAAVASKAGSGLDAVSIGVGLPGSPSPRTGLIQNANSTWLNGRPFGADLALRLGQPVRLANDANCFALSEAVDGAGAGCRSVFGVIIGTGCGGGIVIDGRLVDGPRGIGGEWGHNPLPWASVDDHPGERCWCGRDGCMETWVSGPGLTADYARRTGRAVPPEVIAAQAAGGEEQARAALERHTFRLARGLAHVVNLLDPEVIVLGGGLSAMSHLYAELPPLMAPYIFAADTTVDIRAPRWGDASGVRGAAWLWGR